MIAPSAPGGIEVVPGNFSAQLSWMMTGQVFANEYRLTYMYTGTCGEGTPTTLTLRGGSLNTYIITNLTGGSLYRGELTAINNVGSSGMVTFNFTTLSTGTYVCIYVWVSN